MTKKCPQCGNLKELVNFSSRPGGKHNSWCRECAREKNRARREFYNNNRRVKRAANLEEYRARGREEYQKKKTAHNAASRKNYLRRVYGLTPAQYGETLSRQEGCPICLGPLTKPRLDHCHKTGRVREFLCHNCNVLLGHAREQVDVLQRAINYITSHTI